MIFILIFFSLFSGLVQNTPQVCDSGTSSNNSCERKCNENSCKQYCNSHDSPYTCHLVCSGQKCEQVCNAKICYLECTGLRCEQSCNNQVEICNMRCNGSSCDQTCNANNCSLTSSEQTYCTKQTCNGEVKQCYQECSREKCKQKCMESPTQCTTKCNGTTLQQSPSSQQLCGGHYNHDYCINHYLPTAATATDSRPVHVTTTLQASRVQATEYQAIKISATTTQADSEYHTKVNARACCNTVRYSTNNTVVCT